MSQHIKHLEEAYNTKLFDYQNKRLSLTSEGELLYEYAIAMKTSADKVKDRLENNKNNHLSITFGTTLTIGEYTMRPILKKTLKRFPKLKLSMNVNNTKTLLQQLRNGSIDFAILEGHFNKSTYDFYPFKNVSFIGVCSPNHKFSNKEISFHDLLNENIILREQGSGTRNIFERILYEQNFTLESLQHYIEIGNMKAIKDLVKEDFGISFLYKESVREELKNGTLQEIKIDDFKIKREFNFVYLKGSLHEKEYIEWFKYFIQDN